MDSALIFQLLKKFLADSNNSEYEKFYITAGRDYDHDNYFCSKSE